MVSFTGFFFTKRMEDEMQEKEKKGLSNYVLLITFLGVCGTSASVLFVRLADAPSLVLAAYRKTFVTIMLLPVILLRCREEIHLLTLRQVLWCALSGVCLAIHFFTYFEAVNNASIATAQVLVSTEVIFVALVMWLTGKESLNARCILGISLALGGCVLVSIRGGGESIDTLYGIFVSIAAAAALAAYSLIGTSQRKNMSNNLYTFLVYGISAIVLNIMTAFSSYSFTGYSVGSYICALAMAVFCSLLGHSIFNWSLKYVSPTLVAMIKLLGPVFATLWGIVLLHEIPVWNQILGGIVVIGGICLYIAAKEHRNKDLHTEK